MRTRVLYLISSLAQGGAERHLLELVRCLDTRRFEPVIAVLRPDLHYREDGAPARIVLGSGSWPAARGRLITTLRAVRPAIVHCYLNDGNLWGRLATQLAPGRRPRVLTSVHLDDMSLFYRGAERLLRRASDRIVAHSESIRRLLVDRLQIPSQAVQVIANGVDTTRFRPPTDLERERARHELAFTRGELVAVMPARLCAQKNQTGVLAALGQLRAAGHLPRAFRLVLAGRVSSQVVLQQIRFAIWRHRLDAHVQLAGPVADVKRLLWAADVALLPSLTEASPLAALEAMATGLPLALTHASNTDRVLVDSEHGWELADHRPGTIADALYRVFTTSRAQRIAMGSRARAHVEANFLVRRVADDFQRLYAQLAS